MAELHPPASRRRAAGVVGYRPAGPRERLKRRWIRHWRIDAAKRNGTHEYTPTKRRAR